LLRVDFNFLVLEGGIRSLLFIVDSLSSMQGVATKDCNQRTRKSFTVLTDPAEYGGRENGELAMALNTLENPQKTRKRLRDDSSTPTVIRLRL
jgi:hypothetical protein